MLHHGAGDVNFVTLDAGLDREPRMANMIANITPTEARQLIKELQHLVDTERSHR